jgi:hypothetical protein
VGRPRIAMPSSSAAASSSSASEEGIGVHSSRKDPSSDAWQAPSVGDKVEHSCRKSPEALEVPSSASGALHRRIVVLPSYSEPSYPEASYLVAALVVRLTSTAHTSPTSALGGHIPQIHPATRKMPTQKLESSVAQLPQSLDRRTSRRQ